MTPNLGGLRQQVFIISQFLWVGQGTSSMGGLWLKASCEVTVKPIGCRLIWGWLTQVRAGPVGPSQDSPQPSCRLSSVRNPGEKAREHPRWNPRLFGTQLWKWHPIISAVLSLLKGVGNSNLHSTGHYTRAWVPRCGLTGTTLEAAQDRNSCLNLCLWIPVMHPAVCLLSHWDVWGSC